MAIHENFYETITTKNKVIAYYNKLYFSHDNTNIYTASENTITNTNTVLNVSLFPSYLQPEFNIGNTMGIVKIPQKKITGYAVLINGHTTLESLLKTAFKKSFRANILRFVNRFEACFNAKYRLFFGDISKEEYTFLMATLHNMLTNRFEQRKDANKVLNNWDAYLSTTFDLIKEKKASLFVIYNDVTPVHICINHHFNTILFVSVPSYDIDYAKFALGNVSLYKLLEWSVNNHYEVMDMAQGYLEYKRRWSTLIYEFDHHIIYKKKSTIGHISALTEVYKLHFKNFLKSKNVDTLVEKLKKGLKKHNAYQKPLHYQLEVVDASDTTGLKEINAHCPMYQTLRIAINDFLFIHKERNTALKIMEITKDKEYLLQGERISQKVTIN